MSRLTQWEGRPPREGSRIHKSYGRVAFYCRIFALRCHVAFNAGNVALAAPSIFAAVLCAVVSSALSKTPENESSVRLDVLGHQWWWELHYHDGDPAHDIPWRFLCRLNASEGRARGAAKYRAK